MKESIKISDLSSVLTAGQSAEMLIRDAAGALKVMKIPGSSDVSVNGVTRSLHEVAWGVPINQEASNPEWGVIGNTGMFAEYAARTGRFLVKADGSAAKLSAVDSSVFADGTTADESKGNVMVIAPCLYYLGKTDTVAGITYAWFSTLPIGGYKIGDCNGGENICIGAYLGAMAGSALVSRSGLSPAGDKTINAFWNAAQVNGPDWGIVDYDHAKWMLFMGLSKYGSPDIQRHLGFGVCGQDIKDWNYFLASAANLKTGATKTLGDTCGEIRLAKISSSVAASAKASRVNLFGVEDWWGWFWQMIQGIYCGSSANSGQSPTTAFIYEGNRMPSSAELASKPTGTYRTIYRPTSTSEGWISKLTLGDRLDVLPAAHGGGDSVRWTDYSWQTPSGQLLLWGGSATSGSRCGLASSLSNTAWSYSYATVGSRLAYYGMLKLMSGKELMAL